MPVDAVSDQRRKTLLAVSLVAFPITLFYAILFRFAVNVPLADDYDAGLRYLNQSTQIPTFSGRMMYLLVAQQNEYKIVFGHAVVWLQYAVFGNLNLKLTCALGNIFVLPLGWLLWRMFLPEQAVLAKRLALFAPVSLLLFQLNYTETLDWAMPGLQNINVVFFALAAIYLLTKPAWGNFCAAIAMLVLAISASGNGFFIVPIGVLILDTRRRYAHLAAWIAATAISLAAYLYHYTVAASSGQEHHSFLATYFFRDPLYLLSFLGSAAFFPKPASLLLGLAIVFYLAYMIRRGYWRRNLLVAYCTLFVLLTALAVTSLRSQIAVLGGTSSRYRIYCDLLLIFAWFAFAEEFVQHRDVPLLRNRSFVRVLAVSCLFALLMDAWGIYFLAKRDRDLVRGMTLFEHPQPMQPPGPVYAPPDQPSVYYAWDTHTRAIMIQSIQLGIYDPPPY